MNIEIVHHKLHNHDTNSLIDHDTKIVIVGLIPGSTEPLLCMSMYNDRM